jgi:hypothetical protein
MVKIIKSRRDTKPVIKCLTCEQEILPGYSYKRNGGASTYHIDCKIVKRKKLFAVTTSNRYIRSQKPGG